MYPSFRNIIFYITKLHKFHINFHNLIIYKLLLITSISINSEKTKVTSLRINEDIYNLIKERAVRDKCSISDIVNKSLMDYLNNYL